MGLGAILAFQWFSSDDQPQFIRRVLAFLNSKATLMTVLLIGTYTLVCGDDSLLYLASTIAVVNYLTYRLIRRIIFHRGRRFGLSWLAGPLPVFFGSISYGLYMYHPLVFELLNRHLGTLDPMRYGAALGRFTLLLATTVLVCVISLYCMEIPIQRLRRFVLRPTTKAR